MFSLLVASVLAFIGGMLCNAVGEYRYEKPDEYRAYATVGWAMAWFFFILALCCARYL